MDHNFEYSQKYFSSIPFPFTWIRGRQETVPTPNKIILSFDFFFFFFFKVCIFEASNL